MEKFIRLKTQNILLILLLFINISGCGGGGSGADNDNGSPPNNNNTNANSFPDAISSLSLSVGPTTKTLNFSWQADVNSTFYRIYEDPDGQSGYTQLGQDLPPNQTTYSHVVPLYNRITAQYRFDNCNTNGCTSTSIPLSPNEQNNWFTIAAGELLPDNPRSPILDSEIYFADQIAMNRNANVLAVGAFYEGHLISGVFTDTSLIQEEPTSSVGAVYIYEREPDGVDWEQRFFIKPSNPDDNDQFGRSVSISADGNTLVVGAYGESSNATGVNGDELDNSVVRAGATYVFVKQGNTWVQQAYIKPLDPSVNGGFGSRVALSEDGNTLVAANATGNVYVFARQDDTWAQTAKLQAPVPMENDYFGVALSLNQSGDRLFVGSTNAATTALGEANLEENRGAVFIFSPVDGVWQFVESILAFDGESNDRFGSSITLSGDETALAIGATGDSTSSFGSVYLYRLTDETWQFEETIQANNSEEADTFGYATALNNDGTALVVGAPWKKTSARGVNDTDREFETSSVGRGMVYVYSKRSGQWQQTSFISNQNRSSFGVSILLNGASDLLLISASSRLSNDPPNPAPGGAVLIY